VPRAGAVSTSTRTDGSRSDVGRQHPALLRDRPRRAVAAAGRPNGARGPRPVSSPTPPSPGRRGPVPSRGERSRRPTHRPGHHYPPPLCGPGPSQWARVLPAVRRPAKPTVLSASTHTPVSNEECALRLFNTQRPPSIKLDGTATAGASGPHEGDDGLVTYITVPAGPANSRTLDPGPGSAQSLREERQRTHRSFPGLPGP